MTAKEYLEYLIFTQKQYETGEVSIGVQASELAMLQAFLKAEK